MNSSGKPFNVSKDPYVKRLCHLIDNLDKHCKSLSRYQDNNEDADYIQTPQAGEVKSIIVWFNTVFYTELQELERDLKDKELKAAVRAVKRDFSSDECPLMGRLDSYYRCLLKKGEANLSAAERNYRFQASFAIRDLVEKLVIARSLCNLLKQTDPTDTQDNSGSARSA